MHKKENYVNQVNSIMYKKYFDFMEIYNIYKKEKYRFTEDIYYNMIDSPIRKGLFFSIGIDPNPLFPTYKYFFSVEICYYDDTGEFEYSEVIEVRFGFSNILDCIHSAILTTEIIINDYWQNEK